MWINKIFSNYEDGENLYNVIMNKDEVALFSDLTWNEKAELFYNKHFMNDVQRNAVLRANDPNLTGKERTKARVEAAMWTANNSYRPGNTTVAFHDELYKHSKRYRNEHDRLLDMLRVANGNLTKEDYLKKYRK